MRTFARSVAIICSLVLSMGIVSTASAADKAVSLEERVQRLEDRAAIQELLVTYGRLLDVKDLAGYSKLFAKDGVWEGGIGSATGPAGIYDMLDKVFKRVEPGSYGKDYHIMSDFLISVDGNTATSRSNWTWIVEGDSGSPVASRSGHYEDQLVKIDGVWKFKYRLTVTDMPTPDKDAEAQIYRKDHRDTD